MDNANDLLLHPGATSLNRRRFFFKYMTSETALVVLTNQTLRWSTPQILNDPFDMNFDLQIDADLDRVRKKVLDQSYNDHFGESPAPPGNRLGALITIARQAFAKKGISMTRDEFEAQMGPAVDESLAKVFPGVETAAAEMRPMLSSTKVLCLTVRPDNMLMWSHYGQQHSGIVIRFETVPELDSPYSMARQVNYTSEMPRWMDEQGLADLLSGRKRVDTEELVNKLIYTKSSHWSYEAEWRVSSGLGRDRTAPFEDLRFGAPELESLIFGCRIEDERREEIKIAAKRLNPKVKFWHARPAKREFRMDIIEAD
jgi:hypothetical protein